MGFIHRFGQAEEKWLLLFHYGPRLGELSVWGKWKGACPARDMRAVKSTVVSVFDIWKYFPASAPLEQRPSAS